MAEEERGEGVGVEEKMFGVRLRVNIIIVESREDRRGGVLGTVPMFSVFVGR